MAADEQLLPYLPRSKVKTIVFVWLISTSEFAIRVRSKETLPSGSTTDGKGTTVVVGDG